MGVRRDWNFEFEKNLRQMETSLKTLRKIAADVSRRFDENEYADLDDLLDRFENVISQWKTSRETAYRLIAAKKVPSANLERLLNALNPYSIGVSPVVFPGLLEIPKDVKKAIDQRLDQEVEDYNSTIDTLETIESGADYAVAFTGGLVIGQLVATHGTKVLFHIAVGVGISKGISTACDQLGVSKTTRKIALLVSDVAQLILIRRNLLRDAKGSEAATVPRTTTTSGIVQRAVTKVLEGHRVVWDAVKKLFKLCTHCEVLLDKIDKAEKAATGSTEIISELRNLKARVKEAEAINKTQKEAGALGGITEAQSKSFLVELEEIASRDVRVAESLKTQRVLDQAGPKDATSTTESKTGKPPVDLSKLPPKVLQQIEKNGLPSAGQTPFEKNLKKNKKGEFEIDKGDILKGPKKGKKGYLDKDGRIWIKDPGHSGYPDHWDVQINGGDEYFRVGVDGNPVVRQDAKK